MILTESIQGSEESDAKRKTMEAELEEKRREQERKHEENMMTMMMGFMNQMMGFPHPHPSTLPTNSFSKSIPIPPHFPSPSNPHSYPTTSFPPTQPFPPETNHSYFYYDANNDDYTAALIPGSLPVNGFYKANFKLKQNNFLNASILKIFG